MGTLFLKGGGCIQQRLIIDSRAILMRSRAIVSYVLCV